VFKFEIGEQYFVQTITNYWLGTVAAVDGSVVTLRQAYWIADTGRFGEFTSGLPCKKMKYEVLAAPVQINLDGALTVMPYPHEFPPETDGEHCPDEFEVEADDE
jgi:hypothetical protein